jgi:hypothetical protein
MWECPQLRAVVQATGLRWCPGVYRRYCGCDLDIWFVGLRCEQRQL